MVLVACFGLTVVGCQSGGIWVEIGRRNDKMFDAEKAYWNQRETLLEKYVHFVHQRLRLMEGKWVAIVNGEVATVGDKNTEVMLEAFQKTGCKVMYVNKVGHEKTALRKML